MLHVSGRAGDGPSSASIVDELLIHLQNERNQDHDQVQDMNSSPTSFMQYSEFAAQSLSPSRSPSRNSNFQLHDQDQDQYISLSPVRSPTVKSFGTAARSGQGRYDRVPVYSETSRSRSRSDMSVKVKVGSTMKRGYDKKTQKDDTAAQVGKRVRPVHRLSQPDIEAKSLRLTS